MKGNITRRGDRSWRLKFDNGRDAVTGKRNIQYVTFVGTKADAEVKLRALMGAADKGSYVEPSKVTLAQFLRDRLAQWKAAASITPKTAERYGELIEHQIVPHIGTRLLQKLKPLDIETWHSTLKATGRKDGKGGVSARTIIQAHRVLGKALDEAVKNDLAYRNVASLQSAPAIDGEEVEILGPEQVGQIVTELRGQTRYPVFVTALFTGMRRGELLALRWGAVDLDAKTIQVREALEETKKGGLRVKEPKSRAGRREITLPDVVVNVLRDHRRAQTERRSALNGEFRPENVVPLRDSLPDAALVFPADNGEHLSPAALTNAWRRAAEALGFDGITLHALRHTHASQLIEAGVDIVSVSRRLGHASPNVTLGVYAHIFRQRDDKAAAAINNSLAGLGAG